MVKRLETLMLLLFPLVALGVIFWVMRDATALLNTNLERTTQP